MRHLCLALLLLPCFANAQRAIYLDSLNLNAIEQGWGAPKARKTMMMGNIRLGGKTYARGIGTHAYSTGTLELQGKAARLVGLVGIDDTVAGQQSAKTAMARILADGKIVWRSTRLVGGQGGQPFDLDMTGVRFVELVAEGEGGTNHTHIDWADIRLYMQPGQDAAAPTTFYAAPEEAPYILTPAPGAAPRITGPAVFGVTPGHQVVHMLTATGKGPLKWQVTGLPAGVVLDAATGKLSGKTAARGHYKALATVQGPAGKASRAFTLVVGDTIALTPPLGWNSWNAFGMAVTGERVRKAADAFVRMGLASHGWAYVNVDDGWQGTRTGPGHALAQAPGFEMAATADHIHSLGLKAGLYSTPWVSSYGKKPGGSADDTAGHIVEKRRGFGLYSYHLQDAAQYGRWGYDYLKYDWYPLDAPHVNAMRAALRASGRDIVYSLSNTGELPQAKMLAAGADAWRTTGDIIDTWNSVLQIGLAQPAWAPYCGPGHWPDPDMLVVGRLGWGDGQHATRLRPSQQYSHITLWAMMAAPMLIGCDLDALDAFTLGLLTNDDVLDINQDPLGRMATYLPAPADSAQGLRWLARPLADGDWALACINLSPEARTPTLPLAALAARAARPAATRWRVQDCWRQRTLSPAAATLAAQPLPAHAAGMWRLRAVR